MKKLVLHIKYTDEVARKMGETNGVEITYYICIKSPEDHDFSRSVFNTKGMSKDQIFEEVKRRAEAVKEARSFYPLF